MSPFAPRKCVPSHPWNFAVTGARMRSGRFPRPMLAGNATPGCSDHSLVMMDVCEADLANPNAPNKTPLLALAGCGGSRRARRSFRDRELPRWFARRLRSQAEAAARSGDWAGALKIWREINSSDSANGLSHLGEARASLALGRAFQSEQALRRSVAADPENLESWQLLLQILRVEDRALDASRTGWQAYGSVGLELRPTVLKELTLALLAELPDDDVRRTLNRWIDADKNDLDARVALIERMAIQPRAGDPDRATLLAELETIVAEHPDHITAREALVTALADAGEPERGRAVLDEWPASARDSRYWRLLGRWDLEYNNQPAEAATAFRTALEETPEDWRSWYRLARALRALGREEESRQAAETVRRIRGALDPLELRPLLDTQPATPRRPGVTRKTRRPLHTRWPLSPGRGVARRGGEGFTRCGHRGRGIAPSPRWPRHAPLVSMSH